ncbi:MAG: hypothetical protein WCK95_05235 [Alphaproteobacteria bacterium]
MARRLATMAIISMCAFGLQSATSQAQTPAAEWAGVWKLKDGEGCGDGIAIKVAERPGLMTVLFEGNNRGIRPSTREVPLAADGSGKAEFRSETFGAMTLEAPAGKGKRVLLLTQLHSPINRLACRWTVPN